jgi:hypothetical protein
VSDSSFEMSVIITPLSHTTYPGVDDRRTYLCLYWSPRTLGFEHPPHCGGGSKYGSAIVPQCHSDNLHRVDEIVCILMSGPLLYFTKKDIRLLHGASIPQHPCLTRSMTCLHEQICTDRRRGIRPSLPYTCGRGDETTVLAVSSDDLGLSRTS